MENKTNKKELSLWIECLTVIALATTLTFINCNKKEDDKTPQFAAAALASRGSGTVATATGTATGTGTGAAATYAIGGTITGLTASGLVLQNNAGDDLTVASGATSFTFATKVTGAYAVTVKTQPTGLKCTVTSGTGTATANVSNVTFSCGNTIIKPWGTFTEMNDGTVRLEVTAGTFGSQTYTAQTLYYAKCLHGQTYDAATNTCTGSFVVVTYCSTNDNACNGGTNTGTLNGTGTSASYSACNALNLSGKTWRVPTKNELKLLINCNNGAIPDDTTNCGVISSPTINGFFTFATSPFDSTNAYFGSSSSGSATQAWTVTFFNGDSQINAGKNGTSPPIRCVSGP